MLRLLQTCRKKHIILKLTLSFTKTYSFEVINENFSCQDLFREQRIFTIDTNASQLV